MSEPSSTSPTPLAAMRYTGKLGWPVFPVNPQNKRPLIADNLNRASRDEHQVREWWSRWPGAAIGIACGQTGIYVVDPDAGMGREMSLPALIDAHGDEFLETVTHESGGGGMGLFYRMPPKALASFQGMRANGEPGPLGVGIDGRGVGGYIVVPPSRHPSGKRYEWLIDRSPFDMELAPMPGWMVQAISERRWIRGDARVATLATHLVDRARRAVAAGSGRNDTGFWAACQLRDNGYSREDALEALLSEYLPGLRQTDTKGRVERYGEREVAATIDSVYSRPAREPWCAEAQRPEPEKHSSGPTDSPSDARKLVFLTARDFASSVPEAVPWLVPGYLAKGAITELGGKVKRAGKTTLALAACSAVVRGAEFLERATAAGPVVYLTEQSGSSFREGLRRAGLLDRTDFYLLPWKQTTGMEWEEVATHAAAFARNAGADLMVVDTLGQFARVDGDAENSAGAALAAMRPLQEAAAAGLAVAVLRHERKSGGDVGDSTRGSSAFSGAVDIVLALRRVEGSTAENVRVLYGLSRFDETPDELAIELGEDGVYRVLGGADHLASRLAREYLLAALPTEESLACPSQSLAEGSKVSRQAVYDGLAALYREGLVSRKGEGKRGSPYVYWRPKDGIVHKPNSKADE